MAAQRLEEKLPADATWPDPFLNQVEQVKLDRRTRIARALAVRQQQRMDEYYRLLEDLEQDYPGTLAQMEGRRMLEAKDYSGANRAFEKAIGQDPDFAQAHFWRGVTLLHLHSPRAAAGSFRDVLRLQPTHAAAFEQLGRCLEELGDRTAAVDAYRSAVRYLPQLPDAHARLGMLLAEQSRYAEAVVHLERALSLKPDLPAARVKVPRDPEAPSGSASVTAPDRLGRGQEAVSYPSTG